MTHTNDRNHPVSQVLNMLLFCAIGLFIIIYKRRMIVRLVNIDSELQRGEETDLNSR